MSCAAPADTADMAQGLLFTNHMHVLAAIAQCQDCRLREIARQVGITERTAHRIITELVTDGYLTRTRVGSRNRYEIHPDAPLGHPLHAQHKTEQVIRLMTGGDAPPQTDPHPDSPPELIDAASAPNIFGEAFRAAPAGMVVTDQTGHFLAVNPAYCTILGRSEDELLGRDSREFTHPDDIPADEEGLRKLATGARSEYAREKRYLAPDGTPILVKLRAAATTHPQTGAQLFVAHVVDINERKGQDQALAEAEERFRSAFDNAPIGMALVAPDGRWLKVNRSLCELTGYPETALLVRSFQSITHPSDLDADLEHVHDVLAGRRRTYQMEKRYYHAHGHVIWVTLSVSLVRDAAGEPLYFISQIEDITERKQREQALRDETARLATLAVTDPVPDSSPDPAAADRSPNGHNTRNDRDGPRGHALIDRGGSTNSTTAIATMCWASPRRTDSQPERKSHNTSVRSVPSRSAIVPLRLGREPAAMPRGSLTSTSPAIAITPGPPTAWPHL
jgi:PAS domain S-box-containing protein